MILLNAHAAKLVRFGLAESVRFIRPNTLLLDPFCKIVLSTGTEVSSNQFAQSTALGKGP